VLGVGQLLETSRAAIGQGMVSLIDRLPSPERLAPVTAPAGGMLLVLLMVLIAGMLLA